MTPVDQVSRLVLALHTVEGLVAGTLTFSWAELVKRIGWVRTRNIDDEILAGGVVGTEGDSEEESDE